MQIPPAPGMASLYRAPQPHYVPMLFPLDMFGLEPSFTPRCVNPDGAQNDLDTTPIEVFAEPLTSGDTSPGSSGSPSTTDSDDYNSANSNPDQDPSPALDNLEPTQPIGHPPAAAAESQATC